MFLVGIFQRSRVTWEILFVFGLSYNRNFLLKVPEGLPQFNIIDNDFEIFDKNLIGAPCNKIQFEFESKNNTQLETMYQRYFRCGFKATFSVGINGSKPVRPKPAKNKQCWDRTWVKQKI